MFAVTKLGIVAVGSYVTYNLFVTIIFLVL